MRLLLIAPVCNGDDIGEARCAFQWASRMAERHDVTLLTYHKRGHRPASEQLHGLRVVEWREPPLVGRAERFNSMLAPGYISFYLRARRWIKTALARGERFDIVHQPVPVAMRYPCPADGLGLKTVIGPVGGGLSSPAGFMAEEKTGPVYMKLRGLDRLRLRHDRLLRRSYESAQCVFGIAPYVAERLTEVKVRRFEVMSETALSDLPVEGPDERRPGPLRAVFVGRLVRTKGLRDAIRAFALCRDLDLVLDVVGDGPDRAACEALAEELGLSAAITFHGAQPRDAVAAYYRRADMFVFPSYREPGGNVIFEAMGYGLPMIVCDRGGPGATTDDTCAFRLPVTTPEALARDVAAALRQLVEQPDLRRRMGRASRDRIVATGTWDRRIAQAEAIYRDVADRPLEPTA